MPREAGDLVPSKCEVQGNGKCKSVVLAPLAPTHLLPLESLPSVPAPPKEADPQLGPGVTVSPVALPELRQAFQPIGELNRKRTNHHSPLFWSTHLPFNKVFHGLAPKRAAGGIPGVGGRHMGSLRCRRDAASSVQGPKRPRRGRACPRLQGTETLREGGAMTTWGTRQVRRQRALGPPHSLRPASLLF